MFSSGEIGMNDGIVAMIIQWCLLCFIWMGSLDLPLRKSGLSRSHGLAVLAGFLLSSFVSWRLFFLPLEISISGAVLPLLSAGWMYARLAIERRRYLLLSACFIAFLLFALRKMIFFDPVLLIADELLLLPALTVATVIALTRSVTLQLFILLVSLPLSDVFYMLSFFQQVGHCRIGSGYAQDLLWSSIALWASVIFVWSGMKNRAAAICAALILQLKGKSKSHPDR
jgi:hypothetical protein